MRVYERIRADKKRMRFIIKAFIQLFILMYPFYALAQENKNSLEFYGFINTDAGYNFNTIHPDWYDVMRPTKLPSDKGAFAPSGNVYYSVRQTRFGVRSSSSTPLGELTTRLEFDLFGFGKDAGQTTIHLINAYGQLGKFGAGQTASVFMDLDVMPVTLDYWGPMTRVFNFNVQLRYIPIQKEKERLMFALERPGGTADGGDYTASLELKNVKPNFNLPNLTAHYRNGGNWGYVQVSGVAKSMKWKDGSDSSVHNLSGSAFGWGFNLNTVVNVIKGITIKFQGVGGKGIENYIADAPADITLKSNSNNILKPVVGAALPVLGFFCFTEIKWTKKFQSSIGYSMEKVNNSDLQSSNDFKMGQYGLVNLRYYPVADMMAGIEYQYGRRDNYNDGFHSIANKIQFSCRINFSTTMKSK
jgi:hypothetical protein